MRRNNKVNSESRRHSLELAKQVARQKYAERQIDNFVKWSIEQKGYVKFKDIVYQHDKHNIKVYG